MSLAAARGCGLPFHQSLGYAICDDTQCSFEQPSVDSGCVQWPIKLMSSMIHKLLPNSHWGGVVQCSNSPLRQWSKCNHRGSLQQSLRSGINATILIPCRSILLGFSACRRHSPCDLLPCEGCVPIVTACRRHSGSEMSSDGTECSVFLWCVACSDKHDEHDIFPGELYEGGIDAEWIHAPVSDGSVPRWAAFNAVISACRRPLMQLVPMLCGSWDVHCHCGLRPTAMIAVEAFYVAMSYGGRDGRLFPATRTAKLRTGVSLFHSACRRHWLWSRLQLGILSACRRQPLWFRLPPGRCTGMTTEVSCQPALWPADATLVRPTGTSMLGEEKFLTACGRHFRCFWDDLEDYVLSFLRSAWLLSLKGGTQNADPLI